MEPDNGQGQQAEAQQPQRQPGIEVMGLSELSSQYSDSAAKCDVISRIIQHGVRRITGLSCHRDPQWSLKVLMVAAPLLEELQVSWALPPHFAAIIASPRLRRLELHGFRARNSPVPSDEVPPPAEDMEDRVGLQWLRVEGQVSRKATAALLRANARTLVQLQLNVGTPYKRPAVVIQQLPAEPLLPQHPPGVHHNHQPVHGHHHHHNQNDFIFEINPMIPVGGAAAAAATPPGWPLHCSDLRALLADAGLVSLRRLVLRRTSDVGHSEDLCCEQLSDAWRALNRVVALCSVCDSDPIEDF